MQNKDLETVCCCCGSETSHSTEGPGVDAALGIFYKFGPSQCLNVAFLAFEKSRSQRL